MTAGRRPSSTGRVVAEVLDAARLSELVGREVRAARIRVKPGSSVVLALTDPGTGLADGWARVLWPDGLSKAVKAERRAAGLGLVTARRPLDGGLAGLVLQHGEIRADPRLRRPLARAGRGGLLAGRPEDAALRYNPFRRLVARDGDRVVRVTAAPDPLGTGLHAFVSDRLAVPRRLDDGADPSMAVLRRTGDADLGVRPDPVAARRAGALFAALHRSTGRLPDGLREALARRAVDPQRQAAAHAGVLDALDPGLADRVRRLAARAPAPLTGPTVLVHGDASPDQVLTDRDGGAWLTDFDRAHLAPAAVDLGSYLTTSGGAEGRAFLAGYREAGGTVPPEPQLRAARARAMLLRVAEPLRRARPDWPALVGERLDRLEEVLR